MPHHLPHIAIPAVREIFRRTGEKLVDTNDMTRGDWQSLPEPVQRWALEQAAAMLTRSIQEQQEFSAKACASYRDELEALRVELKR